MNGDGPVFKKSRWGTNRYVYNADNPVGLALVVISTALGLVVLLLMENRVGPFAPTPEPTWHPPTSYVDVRPYEPLPQDPYGTTPTP
ncbi:hypothetical protein ACIGW0_28125 [Streptomyces bikiniensis]|uniref:Energy transducer TonB n=1 Tax=Streptomyces bikiniensis TaxID=1896 RepID=A0ABW8D045_STRBI